MRWTETLAIALDLFTPVDRSVHAALGDHERRRHVEDLAKRLVVASELAAPGSGGALMLTLLSREQPPDDMAARLTALVEFGRGLDELPPADQEFALRSEVRDEVLHFDRIMDLEALRPGRTLKKRREFVWDAGPLAAAERLLTLLHERRVERGMDRAAWFDVSSHPASTTRRSGDFVTLHRRARPELVAAGRGQDAEAAVCALERHLLRHPLGNAIGLLDYALFLAGQGPVELAAAAVGRSFEERWCDVWAAMEAHYVVVERSGFRHVVREAGTLTGDPLGGLASRYAHRRLVLAEGESLVLVPAPVSDLEDLEDRLNTPNRSGKIFLHETAANAFPGTPPLVLRVRNRDRAPRRDDDSGFVADLVTRLTGGVSGRVHVSLEAGHVHSDRSMGAVQLRGLALGAQFREAFAARAQAGGHISLELTPMIDDDHVVNRISYGTYRDLIADHGFPADELILESSPLVNAIALDLLKRAIRADGNGFRVERLGDNIYLTSPGLRLELVQDVEKVRLGCVLFDTALGMYRTDRAAMQRLFFDTTATEPRDVHAEMTATYDENPNPVDRAAVRKRFDALWWTPWPEIQQSADHTPYLDRYLDIVAARQDAGDRTVILNVLEDYYEPLERKVLRLSELLHVPMPLDAVLFAPYGLGLRRLTEDLTGTAVGARG